MLQERKDHRAEFAFSFVSELVGGASEYWTSEQALAAVWSECYSNETIKRLAGVYLVGSSEQAENNLAKLKAELVKVFGIELEEVK